MRRFAVALVVVAVVAGVFLYVDETSPPWYERLRYPLRYAAIVRAHSRHYGLDPALLAAVIYQESKFDAGAHSGSGAVTTTTLSKRRSPPVS